MMMTTMTDDGRWTDVVGNEDVGLRTVDVVIGVKLRDDVEREGKNMGGGRLTRAFFIIIKNKKSVGGSLRLSISLSCCFQKKKSHF